MNLTRNHLFLCFSAIPIVLHFILLNSRLINFPADADDFLFFEVIEHFNQNQFSEFLAFLFKPHNQIHVLFFGKGLTWIAFLVIGSLQFKYFILFTNLLLLGISYLLYQYIQQNHVSSGQFIALMCILFAPYAAIDNFNLMGVLQHSGSLLFLTAIAFLTEKQKYRGLFILLLVAYTGVSTEAWALAPILAIYMWITRHPFRYFTSVIGVFALLGFGLLMRQQAPSGEINLLQLITQAPIALGVFLGNTAWPLSDSFKIPINAAFGFSLLITSLYCLYFNVKRQKAWIMPAIIWLQLIATGGMICLGRSQGNSITTLILSDRFYSYGSFAILSTYLLLLPIIETSQIKKSLLIGFSICYYIGSCYFFITKTAEFKSRILADANNAFTLHASTSYAANSENITQLIHSEYYHFPKEILLPKVTLPRSIHQVSLQSLASNIGTLSFAIKQIPNKKLNEERRWLGIQSMTHADSLYILPFAIDRPHKPQIIRINSLQLTRLEHKNLWLYTQYVDGNIQTRYLGSLK